MSDIIADLELKVTSSAKGSTDAIDKLSRSLEGLKTSLSGFSDGYEATFTGLANGLSQLKTATTGWDTRGVKSMSASLTKLSASAEQVNRTFSILKSGMIVGDTAGIDALATALKGFTGITVDPNLPALIAYIQQMSKISIPDNIGSKLDEFANAMRRFSGFTVDPNLPPLLVLIQKMSTINIPPDLGMRLVALASALTTFGSISGRIGTVDKSVTSLVSAIASLARADLTTAASQLPILTQTLSDLIDTVRAGGGVDRSLTNLINALTRLARATTTASGAISNLNLTVGQAPRHTERAHRGYNNLYMMLIKFRTLLWGLRTAWRALSSSISDASSLVEVGNVVGTVYSDSARQQLEQLSHDAIQNYGMSELAFKQMASRFQAMGTAMGISNEAVAGAEENFKKWSLTNKATGEIYGAMTGNMSDMSMTLTELAADIGSFYDTSVEDVQTALSAVYTGQTRPLRQFGIDLTQANLQAWALAHGLNADVQSMTQAEKATLRYQYVLYSARNALGDFQRTSDTWANQVKILKNQVQQLGIIFGQTFINAFRPALKAMNKFLSAVISFAQQVFNALGAIFGWKIEITSSGIKDELGDVADTVGDISDGAGGAGDNLGKAAKNAKDLKQQLQGFDKLNLLTTDKSGGSGGSGGKGGSGGSGGSGGGGGGAAGDDLAVKITQQENPILSDIKNLFQLGEFVGDTIANSLNSINWNAIRTKARNFGIGLAEFLNGFFKTDALAALGMTFSQSINTVLEELYGFGSTFDWPQFGRSCREFVDNIFLHFDWKLAADTIDVWVQGIAKAINGFFEDESNLSAIVKGIGTFLKELDIETIALVVGTFTLSKSGAFAFVTQFGSFATASAAFKALITGGAGVVNIPLLLVSIAAIDFAQSDRGGVWRIADEFVTGIEKTIEEILPGRLGAALGTGLAGMVGGGLVGSIFGPAGTIAGLIIGGIAGALASGNWKACWDSMIGGLFKFPFTRQLIEDNVITPFKNAFKGIENGDSLAEIGKNLLWGVIGGIGQLILTPLTLGYDILTWVVDGFKALFDIHSPSQNTKIRDIGANILAGVVEGIKDFIKTPFKIGKSVLDWIANGLSGGTGKGATGGGSLGSFTVGVKAKYETTKAKVKEWWGNTKKWWGDGVTSVKSKYETTKSKVKDWWENTKKWWNGGGKKEVSIQGKYATTKSSVNTWWNNTKTWWGTRFANVTANLTKTKDSLPASAKTISTISKFTTAKDALTAVMKTIATVSKFSTMKDALSAAAKTFATVSKFSSAKDALSSAAKTFTSVANFSKWSKANSFTSTITGMVATISSWSKAYKFSNTVGNMVAQFASWSKAWNFKNTVTGLVASFTSWVRGRATGGLYKNGKWSPIQQYASGGSPNAGQLFIAREAGPELVGSLGGHTAVMNNDQIVSSVAAGVARASQAEIAVLREQNKILMAILNKRSGISSDSVFNAVRAKDAAYKQRTGRSAFSY